MTFRIQYIDDERTFIFFHIIIHIIWTETSLFGAGTERLQAYGTLSKHSH
jgi:hypothetical protein